MATGHSQTFDCDAVVGEVVFAPRRGGTEELDGYYLAFASAFATERSVPGLGCPPTSLLIPQ
jgi:carotenoid cleavage dioxygenase-like enzyme